MREECITAARLSKEAADAVHKAEEGCQDIAAPSVLLRTERDKELGLFVGNRIGTPYNRKDILVLRAWVRANSIIRIGMARDIETSDRAGKIIRALLDLKKEETARNFNPALPTPCADMTQQTMPPPTSPRGW